MTVRSSQREVIFLEGICSSEEAEILLQRLLATPTAIVDLQGCKSLHTAVLQVLLAAKPNLYLPADSAAGNWLRSVLLPAVTG